MDVLVVAGGGLVETLQASPLLRSLHAGLPDARLTLACPPGAATMASHLPGVSDVLPLDVLGTGGERAGAFLRGALALRRRRFHAAAVCAGPVGALLVYVAGIPLRVGLAEGMSRLLLTGAVTRLPGENRTAAWVRLAQELGVDARLHQPTFDPGPAARRVAEERLVGGGLEDGSRLLVAMVPGNGFADPLPGVPARAMSWEPERYAHLCNQLTHRHGAGIVLLGTESDRAMADAVLLDVESPVLDLCGELGTLDEVAAVLERCDLLICGDSPLLHLAAAVGTPSVGLFGPTEGRERAPYGPDHRVVQALAQDPAAGRRLARAPEPPSVRSIRVDDVMAGIESPPNTV
jgi:ADP-heptose:LPS heptosyltransferase